MKKVAKYITITLLMLLGLVCVGILYLFFIPNSTLFGLAYVNDNKKLTSKEYNISDVSISKIKLTSHEFNVEIVPTDTQNISLEVESHSFGFVLTKNKDLILSEKLSSINSDNNVSTTATNPIKSKYILIFDIQEPHGFTFTNNSYIKMFIPKEYEIDLELNNSKAKTSFASNDIYIKNLSYSTTSGDLNIEGSTILGNMSLNLQKSHCLISKEAVINAINTIDLKLTTGRFNANKSVLGDVNIVSNKRGVISIYECKSFNEDESSSGGQINIEKVGYIRTVTSDAIINITEITDGASFTCGTGKISIKKLSGTSAISTTSGNIFINECYSLITTNTKSGNVTINKAFSTVSVISETGIIKVYFDEDKEVLSQEKRTLYANIKSGSLIATGVEHIGSGTNKGITVTKNGKVNLSMTDVFEDNKVTGNTGNVTIIINNKAKYKLTTNPDTPTTGNVRVNLMQITDYNGYTTKEKRETYVNCSASETIQNSLTASTTSGDLLILDTKVN